MALTLELKIAFRLVGQADATDQVAFCLTVLNELAAENKDHPGLAAEGFIYTDDPVQNAINLIKATTTKSTITEVQA